MKAMQEKGLDPAADRKQRIDFTRRILVSFHDMKKAGTVEKIGEKRGVKWRLARKSSRLGPSGISQLEAGLSAPATLRFAQPRRNASLSARK